MYYYYELKIDQKKDQIDLTAPAFCELGILSSGKNLDEAYYHHFDPLVKHWNSLIKNRQRFPKFLSIEDEENFTRDNNLYVGLGPSLSLKIMLHHAMLNKGVSRAQLANLIALTPEEWNEKADRTNVQKAVLITPKNPPQYQRVKRVLDLKHTSKIHEIEDAIRCLDLQIHVKLAHRNPRKRSGKVSKEVEI